MNEILKAVGREAMKKGKEKLEVLKEKIGDAKSKANLKIRSTNNFVDLNIKLAEKIQFSFQIKRSEKSDGGREADGGK